MIDDAHAQSTNKKKTQKEIIDMIYHKLKDVERKNLSTNGCQLFVIVKPYEMSAGSLLEIKCKVQLPDGRKMLIDVDLSINKVLELCNSNLIGTYCTMDDRFLKVALVLKNWNR